jgi:hypothetical protein
MNLQIPPGCTYPPTPAGGLDDDARYRRGPYLEASAAGVIELRIPSPYPVDAAVALWKRSDMRWDKERQEWHRVTTRPLDSLRCAALLYEGFYPEYAEERPIVTPPGAVGRVDFVVGHPERVVVQEWKRGWGPGDAMVAVTTHARADFNLAGALDWCRRHGAEIIPSHDGDYIRCFFDGARSIRTSGQIRRMRLLHPTAQADYAYQ